MAESMVILPQLIRRENHFIFFSFFFERIIRVIFSNRLIMIKRYRGWKGDVRFVIKTRFIYSNNFTSCTFFSITTPKFHCRPWAYCSYTVHKRIVSYLRKNYRSSYTLSSIWSNNEACFRDDERATAKKRTKYDKVLAVATAMEQTTVTRSTGICYLLCHQYCNVERFTHS